MAKRDGDRVGEAPTEARAGVTGRNVRYVPLVATIGVIVLFAVVNIYDFA